MNQSKSILVRINTKKLRPIISENIKMNFFFLNEHLTPEMDVTEELPVHC